MVKVFDFSGSVKEYKRSFDGILPDASRNCPCGGRLIGHGRRPRWIVSLQGVFEIQIQRMICKGCNRTVSLLPAFVSAFYQCTKDLAEKTMTLWERGLRSMANVRFILVDACADLKGKLSLSSLYRWARLGSWRQTAHQYR